MEPGGDRPVDQLRRALSGNAVLVVGAGISAAATKTAAEPGGAKVALWRGLLEHGIRRCGDRQTSLGDAFISRWLPIIAQGELDEMLAVGDVVHANLANNFGFDSWLKETVGALEVQDWTLLDIIRAYDRPILTTNYDWLLEKATGFEPVLIQSSESAGILRGDSQGIIHLHGHWHEPSSIVLGTHSYQSLLREGTGILRELAFAQLWTLVFVGFGKGLGDPHFAALLRLLSQLLKGTEYRHFQLVAADEVEAAERAVHGYPVNIVSYGSAVGDLAPFLRDFCPVERAITGWDAGDPEQPLDEEGAYKKQFVGRNDVLDEFREAANSLLVDAGVLAGPPARRVFWIHGFAGIGKSTLLRRLCIETKELFKGQIQYVLIDWMPGSRRLRPRRETPVDPPQMLNLIATRLAQRYPSSVLQPFRDAEARLHRFAIPRDDLQTRFNAAYSELKQHGFEWRRALAAPASPEMKSVLNNPKSIRDREVLQRLLAERGIWGKDGSSALKQRLTDLEESANFDQTFEDWARKRDGVDIAPEVTSPVRMLAEGLCASLHRACSLRPLVLVLDTCERLSQQNEWWLRFVIGRLLERNAAMLVLIAAESKPDARDDFQQPDSWRGRISDRRMRVLEFNEGRLFLKEEIEEVLRLAPNSIPPTESGVALLQKATRGVPLVLKVLLDAGLSNADLLAVAGDRDADPTDFRAAVRKGIKEVVGRFLAQLRDRPDKADDLSAIIAVAIQRVLNVPALGRLWTTRDPDGRLDALRNQYAIFKGKELHETVRSFIRQSWHDAPPGSIEDIAARLREAACEVRPPEDDRYAYVAWLLEDLNLALWASLDEGLRLLPARTAVVLAHDSGIEALTEIIAELQETPRAPKAVPEAVARVIKANTPALDGALVIGDPEWFGRYLGASATDFERASVDLVTGLALFAGASDVPEVLLRIRNLLKSAIRYFKKRLPRANQVVRAYGRCLASTSNRVKDPDVLEGLALLRESDLTAELELRNRALLLLYSGDVERGAALWSQAVAAAPSAENYRTLARIYIDYGDDRHFDAADDAFAEAAKLDSDVAANWLCWAALELRRGHKERAAELREKGFACVGGRTDPEGLNSLAWAMYLLDEDLETAERYARTAYEGDDNPIYILHTLTAIEMRRGSWANGRKDLHAMLESVSPCAPTLRWSSIYGVVGDALATRGRETVSVLRSLANADEWTKADDFIGQAEAVVLENESSAHDAWLPNAGRNHHYRGLKQIVDARRKRS